MKEVKSIIDGEACNTAYYEIKSIVSEDVEWAVTEGTDRFPDLDIIEQEIFMRMKK